MTRIRSLLSIIVPLLFSTPIVSAAPVIFSAFSNEDFSNPANWVGGDFPSFGDEAHIDLDAFLVATQSNNFRALRIGTSADAIGELSVGSGGVLVATAQSNGSSILGQHETSFGTLNVTGGTAELNFLEVGRDGTGTLDISGGDVTIIRGLQGNSLTVGTDDTGTIDGTGRVIISGGSLKTWDSVRLGSTAGTSNATFDVLGGAATEISIAGHIGDLDAQWVQNSGATLKVGISNNGLTPIVLKDGTSTEGTSATFASGSFLDVGFIDGYEEDSSWPVLGVENGDILDGGLAFAAGVDPRWSFVIDNSGNDGILSVIYDSTKITVTTNTDEDNGDLSPSAGGGTGVSLREAINHSPSGALIFFDPSLSGQAITLTNGQLLIDKSLTIDASALATPLTIDANGAVTNHRVLTVNTGTTVELINLVITGGKSPDVPSGNAEDGGGILSEGSLALTHCTVTNNTAGNGGVSGSGGGGGGISADTLTLTHCTVFNNIAGNGGGLGGSGGDGGGVSADTLTLTYCTISNNLAGNGGVGGSGGDGGGVSADTLILTHCTVSNNTAGNGGDGSIVVVAGGNGGTGGGISADTLTLTYCTVSNNTAGNGGIGGFGGIGGVGGGIKAGNGALTLENSVIAGNLAGLSFSGSSGNGPDISKSSGSFTGTSINFIGDTSGISVTLPGNILTGEPLLAPLGHYGGPTQTIPPIFGSPLIDAAGTTNPGGTDQRGFTRFINNALDIGAVESSNAIPGFDTPVVNSAGDEFDGIDNGISLREAILFCEPSSTITFDPSLSGQTITLTNGQLLIDKSLTIDASALAAPLTIDANGAVTNHRVLKVNAGTTVELINLVITGGKTSDASSGNAEDGGGILSEGTLTLRHCTISNNTAGNGGNGDGDGDPGGDGGDGGGICADTLTLTRCTVSNNTGGIGGIGGTGINAVGGFGGFGGDGGGISADTLTLTRCTVSNNTGGKGGTGGFGGFGGTGGDGGGISADALTLTRCTVFNNTAGGGGLGGIFGVGGLGGVGGGISGDPLSLTHCTVSSNIAGFGGTGGFGGGVGGLGGVGGGIKADTLTLTHCTVSNNTAGNGGVGGGGSAGGTTFDGDGGDGGGISAGNGALTLENSVIAGNLTGPSSTGFPGSDPDISKSSGSFTGTSINFIGDTSGISVTLPGNILTGEPLLAPLGHYGGPTQTIPPIFGSPLIDAAGTSALATDQRGLPRSVGGSPDIGAYESGNPAGYSAWAAEMISAGLDASFGGDAENDDSSNGSEYALGTGALISDPDSPNNPAIVTNGSGGIQITFGLNLNAALDTKWIIKRSTDLVSYTEIYNYDGPTASSNPVAGVSAVVGAGHIRVTDENPPEPRAFYKFEAKKYGDLNGPTGSPGS